MGCSGGRKTVKPPPGCEGYLTRHQAAIRLRLRSEFKIRQFEREGRLNAVRGRMGTAFYPEGEVLALRSELGDAETRPVAGRWTDADLIALLRQPTTTGRLRTAVDLVAETRISIARAERVYRFWCRHSQTLAARVTGAAHPLPKLLAEQASGSQPVDQPTPEARPEPAAAVSEDSSASERRSASRLSHDGLIRSLRDPDPRVRARAFARLKDCPRSESR